MLLIESICNYLPTNSNCLLYYLDDICQFWLDDGSKVLTSPYFDGIDQRYYHNLNCTWMLEVEQGSYIKFEIDNIMVKNNT